MPRQQVRIIATGLVGALDWESDLIMLGVSRHPIPLDVRRAPILLNLGATPWQLRPLLGGEWRPRV